MFRVFLLFCLLQYVYGYKQPQSSGISKWTRGHQYIPSIHHLIDSKLQAKSSPTSMLTAQLTTSTSAIFQHSILKNLPFLRAFINPTSIGGLLAGGLHAVTGPDHLAALLPSSVGKTGWGGARVGAIWGLGHGLSAMFLGYCAFFLKDKITGKFSFLDKLATLAETAVGVSLLAIGLLGVKESMEIEEEHAVDAMNEGKGGKGSMTSRAIFANGILHGFSWDGAPSIAPAIAMTSWKAATIFLFSYSLGTIITMSISAGTIGALSTRIGKMSKTPDFPKGLSFFSSLLAVVIGLYWIAQSFI